MFKSNSIINFEHILTDLINVKVNKQTLATCVKWLFNHEINYFYCHCPVDMFFLAVLSIFGGYMHGEPGGAEKHRTVKRGYI